jgi:hypothetical protein
MKINTMKILSVVLLILFVGAGVALADDDGRYPRGHAYGHHKHGEKHRYQHYAPPRPVYVEHRYCPVVVERHVYHRPVRYAAPPPSGYFFGMSVFDAGTAFSFGVSGR